MGHNLIVYFYLVPSFNPLDFGFEEKEDGWILRHKNQSSGIWIDKETRKISPTGPNSFSSKCLATLFRIAERGGIEIEDMGDKARVRMSLTQEERLMVEELRAKKRHELDKEARQ